MAVRMVLSKALLLVVLWGLVLHVLYSQAEDSQNVKKKPIKKDREYNVRKTREHINRIHSLQKINMRQKALEDLLTIYQTDIKPLELAYRFMDLNKDAILDSLILAKPLLILLGPWSTGKTTFINYILQIENSTEELYTGPQPTTSDFMIIHYGTKYKTSMGTQLISDHNSEFSPLEQFGQQFLERLQGVEIPSPLLQQMTIVDTPGILENKKQQNRGYPFNDVINWFLQRASTVFLMFDPTKMEVGSELEVVLDKIKGHEGKVRLILNKADTLNPQELMKVYGALFWNLAPIIKSIEPPRVYVVSLWSKSKFDFPQGTLFEEEEIALLTDLQQSIENQAQNKVSYFRKHASMVRCHALTVDSFLKIFNSKQSYFVNKENLWKDISENPNKHQVFESLLKYNFISKHDLPEPESYKQFFQKNPVELFIQLEKHCSFFGACPIDNINQAITIKLPQLLQTLKRISQEGYCTNDKCY